MQKLFTKGIGHTRFKESAIGQIPESWNIVNIQEISHRIMKGIFDLNPKTLCSNRYSFSKDF